MALGATPGTVLELVIGGGLRIVAIGVAAGVLLTLALSRTAEAILYQTSPRDPLVLGVVCTILLGSAALACLVPARAATRLDPAEVLRAE